MLAKENELKWQVSRKFKGVHAHGITLQNRGEPFETTPGTCMALGIIIRTCGKNGKELCSKAWEVYECGELGLGHCQNSPREFPERQRHAWPWGYYPRLLESTSSKCPIIERRTAVNNLATVVDNHGTRAYKVTFWRKKRAFSRQKKERRLLT